MLNKLLTKKSYILLFIAITGGAIAFYLNHQLQEYEKNQRLSYLENVHKGVVDKFSESLNRFAYLMSGMRSYLRYAEPFPEQEELQKYLGYQVEELQMTDSLIVSYLNTDHEFIYCFTKDEIDPNNLIGTSVRSFRDGTELSRLDSLLMIDKMRLFPPINLIEGWVGIPLNFSVIRNNKPAGYIAAILNFRNIIEPIYKLENSEEFAFSFSVEHGASFDREQVHNNSKVYHNRADGKNYHNYDIDLDKYLFTRVDSYGLTFEIGTAYITDHQRNPYVRWLFLMTYLLLICFTGFIIYRNEIYQNLNSTLKTVNTVIQQQNEELGELNATKNRLMSIIGHDLKGPISSIINLISLVDEEAVSIDDTKLILKQLNPVAKNTINLLENLLQWAMVNSDKTLFKPEEIIVEHIVDENLVLLNSVSQQKNITCLNEIPSNLKVSADYNMFSTVIRNLISNAIKYSEAGTKVTVSGYTENNHTVIAVKDEGVGMSEKEINAINHMELEASKKGTAGEKGTGLGLTLCKAFIAKHGGVLEIQSEKGKGSTFKVQLPTRASVD